MPKQRNPFLFRDESNEMSQARDIGRRIDNLKRAPISVRNRQTTIRIEKPRKPFNPTMPMEAPVGTTPSGLIFSLFEYSPYNAYFYRIGDDLSVTEISIIENVNSVFSGMFVKAGNAHYSCWVDGISGPERIHRSIDGCVTWTDVASLPDVAFYNPEIVAGPDGVLWASIDDDDANNPTLWKSVDDGETWSFVHSFSEPMSGADQVSIAVDPTNADHLIAIGYNDNGVAPGGDPITIGESFNGGISFSETEPTGVDGDSTLTFFKIIDFTPSGKMVACWTDFVTTTTFQKAGLNTGSGWSVINMPNNDPTNDGYSADPGLGPLQIVSEDEYLFGGNVYDSSNQFRLWRTVDGGNTWTLVVNGVTGDDEGMKYYYLNGTLFLANHFTSPAGGPMLLANTDPWGSGTWQTLLTRSDQEFEPAWGQAFALV